MNKNNDYSLAGGKTGYRCFGLLSVLVLISVFMIYPANSQTVRVVQDPADYSTSTFYPADSPGMPEDWHWDNFSFDAYIVPDSLTQLYGVKCQFQWDSDKLSVVSVTQGNIWDSGFFFEHQSGNTYTINGAMHGVTNYTVRKGDYIAKLVLRVEKPCITALSLPVVDIRDVNNQPLSFSATPATAHFFLGDFVAYAFPVIDQTRGDGQVNFGDLSCFGSAYFSTFSDPIYKVKYDIGPTTSGNVFSLPSVDGVINFSDLVIFSLMYGRTSLPKQSGHTPDPFILIKQEKSYAAKSTGDAELTSLTIPLEAKSLLKDVRAMEFSIPGDYAGAGNIAVELSPAVREYHGQLFVAVHARNDKTIVDIAMMNDGMDISGEIGSIQLSGVKSAAVPQVKMLEARNGSNADLLAASPRGGELPSALKLYPNYPNPFNPSTTIRYFRPDGGITTIRIISLLGENVYTAVRPGENEGDHTFTWNGRDDAGHALPSGMYMLQIESAAASAITKIMLLK